MTYKEKLKDPRWQKKRLRILNRDDWACQSCGLTVSTLHVHHFYYETNKEPWDYSDDALITLCDSCHEEEHKMRKYYEDSLLMQLRKQRFLGDQISEICLYIWENHQRPGDGKL